MSEHMVLRLSKTWAVLADDRQWMLCRRRTPAQGTWKPLSYVASSKAVLLRCIGEKGAVVDVEGQAGLDALPERLSGILCKGGFHQAKLKRSSNTMAN
jgi:hypothetical protein